MYKKIFLMNCGYIIIFSIGGVPALLGAIIGVGIAVVFLDVIGDGK